MSTFIFSTPYTRPECLQSAFELFAEHKVKVFNFGGFWRNALLLGNHALASDIDLRIDEEDWNKLPANVKAKFKITDTHMRFLQKAKDNSFLVTDPQLVLEEIEPAGEVPIEISVVRQKKSIAEVIENFDLGFSQVADDGSNVFVTKAFMQDAENQTMTVCRCVNSRDWKRTHKRLQRFEQGLFKGWKRIVPDKYWHIVATIT